MSESDRTPGASALRDALWQWCCCIWTLMRTAVAAASTVVPTNRRPFETINAVASWPDPPEVIWPPDISNQVFHIPEWAAVQRALRTDPLSASQIDQLVGTAVGRALFDENSVAFHLFPTLEQYRAWLDDTDPDELRMKTFEAKFSDVSGFLNRTEFVYEILTPLQGLSASQAPLPLALDATAEISGLSDEEVERLSDAGLLKNPFFGGRVDRYSVQDNMRYALRRTVRVRKLIGDPAPGEEEAAALMYQPYSDAIRIRRVMAVALLGRVIASAYVGRQLGWNPLGGGLGSAKSLIPITVKELPLTPLGPKDVDTVRALWVRFEDPAFSKNLPLRIPVDRMAALNERQTPEDQILDIMIAAEAHYLAGHKAHDKAELLAGRVAAYANLDELQTKRSELYEFMKSAYRVRNLIAHGSEPEPRDLLTVSGAPSTMDRFIGFLERVVRQGLRTSLLSPAEDAPPNINWKARFGVD